jgi:hypothetical protein
MLGKNLTLFFLMRSEIKDFFRERVSQEFNRK